MQYIPLCDKLAEFHFPIQLEWVMGFDGVQLGIFSPFTICVGIGSELGSVSFPTFH